jgi:hypothetical protein
MATYRVAPLHPDRLVCEVCGRAVADVPPGLPAGWAATGLTRQQLAAQFPELANVLWGHDVLCRWRQDP